MTFSFNQFTPSSAGEATSYILDVAAYLAQLRVKNNEVAASDFDISAAAASGNAQASSHMADNDAQSTRDGAYGTIGQGSSLLAPEAFGAYTTYKYSSRLSELQTKSSHIALWEDKIESLKNAPQRQPAQVEEADEANPGNDARKSLLQKLAQVDFTKEPEDAINQAIEAAQIPGNNGKNIPEYDNFLKRLENIKQSTEKEQNSITQQKQDWKNTVSSLGQSTGLFVQGNFQYQQSVQQEKNVGEKSNQIYQEFVQQGFRSIQDMVYKLGDALESSRQSLVQNLLGGLAAANRA